MIGVIALAFELVTLACGLCLLISCALGEIRVMRAVKDVGIILLPMLGLLVLVIIFPEVVLFLPRLLMAQCL